MLVHGRLKYCLGVTRGVRLLLLDNLTAIVFGSLRLYSQEPFRDAVD